MDNNTTTVLVVLVVIALAVYFLPTIIASYRGHHRKGSIFVVNLLLGWSGLGWFGALFWAIFSESQPPVTTRHERVEPRM